MRRATAWCAFHLNDELLICFLTLFQTLNRSEPVPHSLPPTTTTKTHLQAAPEFAPLILAQLMLSTYHGHAALSRLLLSHGADPNRLNDRGQSPLTGAVFKNEKEIVEILLEAGADVDLGQPSAAEAVELFNKTDEFGAVFEKQREKSKKDSKDRETIGGIGGMKGAGQMV